MKKLICTEPGIAKITEYEEQPLQHDEVRVKVIFASPKHGTEIADFKGTTPFIDGKFDPEWQVFAARGEEEPRGIVYGNLPLGNMFTGFITEVGTSVTDYKVGDRVVSYGPIKETQTVKGVDNFRLRKIPQGVSDKNAVCYDPCQFALGGVRDGNVRPGDHVAVIGLGAIGQLAIQMVSRLGASTVIGIDPIEKRCEIAMKKLTDKLGVDVIIETSGHISALQSALKGLAYGGTISYVAFAKPFPQGLWLGQEAHFNNAKIVFSRAASEPNPDYPRWSRRRIEDVCWNLLTNGFLNCEDIIDPVVSFEESAEGFMHYVDKHPEESIKLGVTFKEER